MSNTASIATTTYSNSQGVYKVEINYIDYHDGKVKTIVCKGEEQ